MWDSLESETMRQRYGAQYSTDLAMRIYSGIYTHMYYFALFVQVYSSLSRIVLQIVQLIRARRGRLANVAGSALKSGGHRTSVGRRMMMTK